jgi:hypothetical protein
MESASVWSVSIHIVKLSVDLHARLATADIIWEVEFALWQILFVKPMIKIAEFVSAAMLDIT